MIMKEMLISDTLKNEYLWENMNNTVIHIFLITIQIFWKAL